MNQPQSRATPDTLVARIAGLPDLPMEDIRALWWRLFGGETPTNNRRFLERRIAYKLQEVEFRKENSALLERNQRRIAALIERGKVPKRDTDYRAVPGTVLTREYHGIEHRVVVADDGQYEYQGRRFRTLSMVAREITGTRWSGPVFFGLKQRAPTKRAKAGRA